MGPVGAYRPPEAQLGLLSCFLRDGWLVSWNEYSVYVLDSVNEVGEDLSSSVSTGAALYLSLSYVFTSGGQTTAVSGPLMPIDPAH